ncbi:hypothetical protein QUF70_21265, partial [Desulfobacterales bacterium HSG17]|nr:hypothetical protein [Desulfobacterales bacterium HSG17]
MEVLGVKTGNIMEVFGFEPVDIAVKAGRVDIMVRDENGILYHIEEQRNLRKSDMYRFAAYHFLAAKKWGKKVTDIILASGEVYSSEKKIVTESGTYSPVVIDFTLRDGRKRLDEIREAVQNGTFENKLELVFLPLYGKEAGAVRSNIIEQILRFEIELYHAGKISAKLLAATMIMSNKLIQKERLKELWEEIKMLDILEIAREKGMEEGEIIGVQKGEIIGAQEGMRLGVQEGKTQSGQEMLTDVLLERFGTIPARVPEKIRKIGNPD